LPVEQLNGIPQPLVLLLEVLLAKDPVRRFQNPAELLEVMPLVTDAIEKALVGALAEMYVQRVSTRKVKAITEEADLRRSAT
jgi:hypothetical protein